MPDLIQIAIQLIIVLVLAYAGFWLVGKASPPKPVDLIARCAVGGLALLALYKMAERWL